MRVSEQSIIMVSHQSLMNSYSIDAKTRGNICILFSRTFITTSTYLFSSQDYFPRQLLLSKPQLFISKQIFCPVPFVFLRLHVSGIADSLLPYPSLLHLLGRWSNIFWKLFSVQASSKESNAEAFGYVTFPWCNDAIICTQECMVLRWV